MLFQPVQSLHSKGKQLVAISLPNYASDDLGVNVEIIMHQGITQPDNLTSAYQFICGLDSSLG